LNPASREGLFHVDAEFLQIIEEFGWHVMTVAPRKVRKVIYSLTHRGFFGHPEVIIFDMDMHSLQKAVNAIG
jgi:transketolase N-terminal domain/subunit